MDEINFILWNMINYVGGYIFILFLIILTPLMIYIIFHYSNIKNFLIDSACVVLLLDCYFSFYFKDWIIFYLMVILLLFLCYYKIDDILFNLADLFYNKINEISLMFCNLAIKLDIKQSNIFKLKGDILLENDDFKGAFENYSYVLYLDNNENVLNDIAVTLEYLEEYGEALKFYDSSLDLNPDNILTLNNKAILLMKLKQYDEALLILNKVIEIDENNETANENKEKIFNLKK